MLRQGLLHPVAAPSFLNLKGCRAMSSSHLYPHLTFVNDPGHAFKYDPLPRPRPALLTHIASVLLTLECQEGHCHLPHTPPPLLPAPPRPHRFIFTLTDLLFFPPNLFQLQGPCTRCSLCFEPFLAVLVSDFFSSCGARVLRPSLPAVIQWAPSSTFLAAPSPKSS